LGSKNIRNHLLNPIRQSIRIIDVPEIILSAHWQIWIMLQLMGREIPRCRLGWHRVFLYWCTNRNLFISYGGA